MVRITPFSAPAPAGSQLPQTPGTNEICAEPPTLLPLPARASRPGRRTCARWRRSCRPGRSPPPRPRSCNPVRRNPLICNPLICTTFPVQPVSHWFHLAPAHASKLCLSAHPVSVSVSVSPIRSVHRGRVPNGFLPLPFALLAERPLAGEWKKTVKGPLIRVDCRSFRGPSVGPLRETIVCARHACALEPVHLCCL